MRKCDHCKLSYHEDVMIKDNINHETKYFCCKGCQGIYHLLHEEGLDSFYEKLGKQTLSPPKKVDDDLEKLDLDGFKKRYIKEKDGLYEISLIIEGIHCAACVWLNEKALHLADGIIQAQINGTNYKAKIIWDNDIIKLSQIIKIIQSIGYNAYAYDAKLQEEYANSRRKEYYSKLLVALFSTMNIMWISVAQYAGYFSGIEDKYKAILDFAAFVLATPVLFYVGSIFFKGAYYGLKQKNITMDLLIITGASLAYIFSIYAMMHNEEVYFDSATMIISFVFVGKYLEVLTKKQAVDTLDSLTSTLPTEVCIIKQNEKQVIPVENVEIDDIIEIKAGEKLVIDGVITKGQGSFNTSSISGESLSVLKNKGDEVLSGYILEDSILQYKATKTYHDSMLCKIINLLEDSIYKKPKIEILANQISSYFSVVILSLSAMTFLFWYYNTSFHEALITAISVIIIACPCALALATPVSSLVALGVGAKEKILFKEAKFLETMAKAKVLFLDKTGTITKGKPEVFYHKDYEYYDENLLYTTLLSSNHPISKGVLKYILKQNLKCYEIQNLKNIQARGIEATINSKKIIAGSSSFLKEKNIIQEEISGTHYLFSINGKLCAKFLLKDGIKDNAKEAISEIKNLGIKVVMLTGDNEKAAQEIANEVQIDSFYHSLLPDEKAKIIKDEKNISIMAGDGINDSLALLNANIGISMGSAADISINVSDVVLLDDEIKSLKNAIILSKKTYKVIKQNLIMSLFYNLISIPLAIMGFVIPLIAALFMSFSSIAVVLNSLRIKNKGKS